MATHSMEIRAMPTAVWKGDAYSLVYFNVTYPSHDTKELFHDSSITKLAAFLFLRAKSDSEKPSYQEEIKVVCRRIEIREFLALDFDGNEALFDQPFPSNMAIKLSTLFSCTDGKEPCLVVRAKRDIFNGTTTVDAFRLHIAVEIKRHFPANYTIYSHCKNFFSPVLPQKNGGVKSDIDYVEEDILALSAEEIVDHLWSQVGDEGIVSTMLSLSQNEQGTILSGSSGYIDLFEYKLSIDDLSDGNNIVRKIHGSDEIEWNASSRKSKIEVLVHLKNGKGEICVDYPVTIQTTVMLLYEDGTEAPKFRIGNASSNPEDHRLLLNSLSPFPKFCKGVGSQKFMFRIEQVISRHKNHKGFRLKIFVQDEKNEKTILPFISDDVIVVTRTQGKKSKLKEKQDDISMHGSGDIKEARLDAMDTKMTRESAPALRVPNEKIKELFAGDGTTCLSCHADLSGCEGIRPIDHYPNCRLVGILSPYLTTSSSTVDGYSRFGSDDGGGMQFHFMDTLDKICTNDEPSRDAPLPYDEDFMDKVKRVTNNEDFELIDFNATNEPHETSI